MKRKLGTNLFDATMHCFKNVMTVLEHDSGHDYTITKYLYQKQQEKRKFYGFFSRAFFGKVLTYKEFEKT